MAVVLRAVEAARWLAPYVLTYLEDPKTLDELQSAVNTPAEGTDVHHIVEQSGARQDGFSGEQIEDPSNLARISRFKHWEINEWYMTPRRNYGGKTPREYLKWKSWEERLVVGLDALLRFGVLK